MDTEIKLDIKNLKTLLQNIEKNVSVKVGVLSAKDSRTDGESNSKLAHLHEFGGTTEGYNSKGEETTYEVPARSIVTVALPLELPKKAQSYTPTKESLDPLGDMSEFLGMQSVEIIHNNFAVSGIGRKWDPISYMTSMMRINKGNYSNKPLIDTGQLENSFGYEVIK